MNNSKSPSNFLEQVFQKTGTLFPILCVSATQLILGLFLIPISVFVQSIAEFTATQIRSVVFLASASYLGEIVILLIWTYFYIRPVRTQITNYLSLNSLSASSSEESARAWSQLASFTWKYGIAIIIISLFAVFLPIFGFIDSVLGATSDQLIYVLIGACAFGLIEIGLGTLLIDQLFTPLRKLIFVTVVDNQEGRALGVSMAIKLVANIVILVLVSILLVAPLGYHSTINAMGTVTSESRNAVYELRATSIGVSAVVLIFATGLAFLLSLSITEPIKGIGEVLGKVEKGDFNERAKIIATDEVGELAIRFNKMISRLAILQQSLESQVNERTEQLKATFEVSNVASTILDPEELIRKVVNLITDRFGYYYAAFFLTDESGQWAVLREATGKAGAALKSSGHRLFIGGNSMVGSAISSGTARIALDIGDEPMRFENPLLPETRSEIALPLTVSGRIIGALDVQSVKEGDFSEQDVGTLQSMSTSVATALENARLFQSTQESLNELRGVQREYVSATWADAATKYKGYEYTSSKSEEENISPREVSAIDVPLALRDQIIGELHIEGQQEWTSEEHSLVEAIATQAAYAMENARLLEESKRTAQLERLATEITSKVWASPNTDNILKTAVKELGLATKADEAIIELNIE